MKNIIKDIAIIGFGSQAKSWALNLRDSKYSVTILLRPNSKSISVVNALGFKYLILEENCPKEDLTFKNIASVALLIPDDQHVSFFNSFSHLFQEGCRFIYAHGYSVSVKSVSKSNTQFDHLLLAPKAIASEMRYEYETKGKLAAAYSCEESNRGSYKTNEKFILNFSKDLGINVGPFKTTFKEETICDLFSEQSMLCSLIPYGIKMSYNTLINNGYKPELAFLECWHETKLIANALIELGPEKFFDLISPNALFGGHQAAAEIFDKQYQSKLDLLLDNIENGKFENRVDDTNFEDFRKSVVEQWKSEDLNKMYKVFKNEYKLYK